MCPLLLSNGMVRVQWRRRDGGPLSRYPVELAPLISELHIHNSCVEAINAQFELGTASPKNSSAAS